MITHPDVVFYDFYEAWTDPIEADATSYLGKRLATLLTMTRQTTNSTTDGRTGILAQAAPNIGPM